MLYMLDHFVKSCWLVKSLGEAVVFSIILRKPILNVMFAAKNVYTYNLLRKDFCFYINNYPYAGQGLFLD